MNQNILLPCSNQGMIRCNHFFFQKLNEIHANVQKFKLWICVFPLAFLHREFCRGYERNLHSNITIRLISVWLFLKKITQKSWSLLALLVMTIVFAILMLSPTIALYIRGKLNRGTFIFWSQNSGNSKNSRRIPSF